MNNRTLHLKQIGKAEMKNPKVSKGKEIIKIGEEINEKETKETPVMLKKLKLNGSMRTYKTFEN